MASEMVVSLHWYAKHREADFKRIVHAAAAGAIRLENGDTCSTCTDACSAHTTASACDADKSGKCGFNDGVCASTNAVQAVLDRVPLAVRDNHFYNAVKALSAESAECIRVFDRGKHRWFRGHGIMPYAITLTEKGRDKVNASRKSKDAPLAVITMHYRDVGRGTWKHTEKVLDAEGMSDVQVPTINGPSTPFQRSSDIPLMVDKTIPEPHDNGGDPSIDL